jgi:hypothetical protein
MPTSSLWHHLSRLVIVGTDQVPASADLRAEMSSMGMRPEQATAPDVVWLRQALTYLGMLEKTSAVPDVFTSVDTKSTSLDLVSETEAPYWLQDVFAPKAEPLLRWLIIQLHVQNRLFPAVFLPELMQTTIKRRLWDMIELFDQRALAFAAQLPKYEQIGKTLTQTKSPKNAPPPTTEPLTPLQARHQLLAAAKATGEKKDAFGAQWQALLPIATPILTISEQKDLLDLSFQILGQFPQAKQIEQFNAWIVLMVVHLDPATMLYALEQQQTRLAAMTDAIRFKDIYRLAVLKERLKIWLAKEG